MVMTGNNVEELEKWQREKWAENRRWCNCSEHERRGTFWATGNRTEEKTKELIKKNSLKSKLTGHALAQAHNF